MKDYDKWMRKEGKSVTTIGIYSRSFRVIIKQAIEAETFDISCYPFGKNRYKIEMGNNSKKALTNEDLSKIFNYSPTPDSPEEKAKDFWIFQLLANGINMADVLNIKYSDIHDDQINIIRQKTGFPVEIVIVEQLSQIIDKYGTHKGGDNFVFPNLIDSKDARDCKDKIQNFCKVVREGMKNIGDDLEIKTPITNMSARHSFGTLLMRQEVPMSYIQRAYGHQYATTTENYLGAYSEKTKRLVTSKMLNVLKGE
jgi:integrase